MAQRVFGIVLAAGVLAWLPAPASEKPAASEPKQEAAEKTSRKRVRFGGLTIGAGYAHTSGYPGLWYPYAGPWSWPAAWRYAFYDPWWPAGFYHPGYSGGYRYGPRMGEIKIRQARKDVQVYIDGGYAGTADKLKTMWLEPGAYNLELRAAGGSYARRIYVLSGKSVAIEPEFEREEAQP